MDRSVLRRLGCLLLLVSGCPEEVETPPPPPPEQVESVVRTGVADPYVAAGADRKAERSSALERLKKLNPDGEKLSAEALIETAEAADREQHYKEARDAWRKLVVAFPEHEKSVAAVNLAAQDSFRLGEHSDGIRWFEDAIHLFSGQLAEVRLLRALSTVYLSTPHWGVKKGGELIRARWDQGIYQDTHRLDRTLAVRRLEEARDLIIELEKKDPQLTEERIRVTLDLVGALVRFTPYDYSWHYWYYAWQEAAEDDDTVAEEGADQRVGRWYQQQLLHRTEPRGIAVDANGTPVFEARPEVYGGSTVQRVKFLLHEITQIDQTEKKEHAADALLRQSTIFRARDGAERLTRLAGWWWQGKHPYKAAVEEKKLWELADDEVYGLIATHVGVYRPPEDENVLALLRRVIAEYPQSKAADEAARAVGLFYTTRKQYDRAKQAFADYLEKYPEGGQASDVKYRIKELERADIRIESSGIQLAGAHPQMSIQHRNLTTVTGRARKIDIQRVVAQFKKEWMREVYQSHQLDVEGLSRFFNNDQKRIETYAAGAWRDFELTVEDDGTMRYRTTEVQIPVTDEGLWIVEVTAPSSKQSSRGLVMLSSTAVVVKNTAKGQLVWVVDARTGKPVKGVDVEIFEYWTEWKNSLRKSLQRHRFQQAKTDAQGVARIAHLGGHQHLISVKRGKRFAYSGNGYSWRYHPSSIQRGDVGLMFTDRPVYRPEHEVKLQVWARRRRNAQYAAAGVVKNLRLRIFDPQGATVLNESKAASADGGAEFSYRLPKNAPLGMYRADLQADGTYLNLGGANFRVEEYKAPEFEVSVAVGDGPAKLGEKIPIEISAEYYFGGAVEGGRVRYKIFRSDYDNVHVAPGPWDWLYGRGYGLCYYAYPWFGWWGHWGRRPWVWYPWWGAKPEPVAELVKEGEGVFGADGKLEVALDTRGILEAFGDKDQRLVVKAEVRDSSRRTITGQGEVIATRHQFFTTVDTDRGYYQSGQTMKLSIQTLKPSLDPIEVEGTLRIAKVAFTGDNLDVVEEKPLTSVEKKTDAFGRLEHRWDAKGPGQYRISYVAKDAWGSEVVGSAVVWVWGPDFEGRRFKFNHLEVISDKRTYAIGETARLLISSDVADAHVLFSPKADNGALLEPKILRLKGKTRVVNVPITKAHVPNFFVEATLVGQGKISEEVREIFVPPTEAEMKVEIRPLKKRNRPGKPGQLEVVTTTLDGQPIAASVAVGVYDKSVTYIQPELTPDIRKHFWGQKRTHRLQSRSNLKRKFHTYSYLNRPDQNAISAFRSMGGRFLDANRADAFSQLAFGNKLGGLRGAAMGDVAAGNEESRRESKADKKESAKTPAAVAAPSAGKKAKRRLAKDRAQPSEDAEADDDQAGGEEQNDGAPKKPQVRRNFADTAAWKVVRTNEAGRAVIDWTFPDNLTTWRVKAVGMTPQTRVGQDQTEIITTKDLLVRLQAPRFFRERDRVVISANVHNRLKTKKKVEVELDVTEQLLKVEGPKRKSIEVESGGEVRVDWWVDVTGEGRARVRVSALTDEESDAKELMFPVLVHGMTKTVSAVGSIEAGDGTAEKSFTINVPEERRPEQTELILRWSPTLAGAMMDALPFLLEYPYGCTEQTTSRFVPAVLTKKALQLGGGIKLEALEDMAKSANPQQVNESSEAYAKRIDRLHRRWRRSPVYNQAVMDDMIASGVKRLQKMQRPDGGWGWWGSDRSSVYTTAYVLWGLQEARSADVAIPSNMISRGLNALEGLIPGHLAYYDKHEWVSDTDAFFAYVMSMSKRKNKKLNDYLFKRRAQLSVYGKSLLALALWNLDDKDRANVALRNAAQFLKEDSENETAWLETRNKGWWYWWNNDIESNAFFLRALTTIRPKDKRAPWIIKWLLNNRQNGWYWRSTRDTAVVISSFAHYMRASRFDQTDYDLDVLIDGKVVKTVHIDAQSLLTFDGELRLVGDQLTSGEHQVTFRRRGKGAVYFNSYLSYFTLEEDVQPAGLEIKVERKYFKLVRKDKEHQVFDKKGQATSMTELRYQKVPLATGDKVVSGDLILVELMLESKNDYTFLAFEDPKPAGAEPVALRSGRTYGEAVANMELRDEKVVFFLSQLNQGKLKLDYRLRAEIPGTFHAMPTRGFAMYAPELKANAAEMRLQIEDQPEHP